MNSEHRIEKLLALYSLLLRMMPFEHRRKFSGEMEQLFCDRLRDAAREGVSLRRQALGMFAETLREIILQKVIEMKEARITHWVGSATLGILMVPLIGMQFSSEIKWTVFDFAVAGTALFLTGSAFAFVTRTSTNWTYKSAAVLALIATLFHFWANGAVGMIGSERDNFNGLYHVTCSPKASAIWG